MFYIGLDLGQRRDHSAIVVVERREVRRAFLTPTVDALLVRHVERIKLGTPYPSVVARVREITTHPDLARQCVLAVDGTGVGSPVVETLRTARLGCEILSVTITGGERPNSYYGAGGTIWNVPKQDLMAGVNLVLESGQLKIAKGMAEVASLLKELKDMRARPGRRGRMKMGAEGNGEHDDLVIALALACWSSMRKKIGFGTHRLPGI